MAATPQFQPISRFVNDFRSASRSTLDMFGVWLPPLAALVAAVHALQFLANQYAGLADPYALRILAILVMVPFIFAPLLRTRLSDDIVGVSLVLSLTFTGPGFLFGAWLHELSQAVPNLVRVVNCQYEFAATSVLVVLVTSKVRAALASISIVIAIVVAIGVSTWNVNFQVLNETWTTLLSAYFLGAMAIVVALRKSADGVRASAVAFSRIGALIAHELRTPLLSIQTAAKALQESICSPRSSQQSIATTKPSTQTAKSIDQESVKLIAKEAEAASTLIDIFIVNSASSHSHLSNQLDVRFKVSDAIEESVRRFPYRSERERNAVTISIRHDFELLGPRLLLVHVIFNLLKNALEHTTESGRPTIVIAADVSESECTIEVSDNGRGIDVETQKHLFEPFFSNATVQGTGLGLTFCQNVIAARFHGRIRVESKIGQSTTFTLVLPPSDQLD